MNQNSANTITRADLTPAVANATAILALTDDQFDTLISATQTRLVRALCRESAPSADDPDFAAWKMLLANFVGAVFGVNQAGGTTVTRKSLRNFSVEYSGTGTLNLSTFFANNADLCAIFSECPPAVSASEPATIDDDFPDGSKPGETYPDTPVGQGWL